MARRGRPPHPGPLTPAEERVLEHVRQGLPNAEIAVRLGISVNTVRYHVSNLLGKAGADSREDLARWQPKEEGRGWRWGWLSLGLKPVAVGVVGLTAVAAIVMGAAFLFAPDESNGSVNSGSSAPIEPEDLFAELARPPTAEDRALDARLAGGGFCNENVRLLGTSGAIDYFIGTTPSPSSDADDHVCFGAATEEGTFSGGQAPGLIAMRGASASFGTAAGGSNFYVLIPDGYDEAASEFTWAELVGDNILVVDSDQGVHTREGSLVILPANDGRTPPLVIRAPINVP